MNRLLTVVLAVALAAGLAACKKPDEAAPAAPAATPAPRLSVPTGNTADEWRPYLQQVVRENMEGKKYRRPYAYWIPGGDDEAAMTAYQDQLDQVGNTLGRGIQAGSLIAFGSPDSKRMGDLVVEAFKLAAPKSLKGVRVVFIGNPEDEARVREAVAPSEADFKFVEMK